MKMSLTPSQHEAATTIDKSLAVIAGAGSGKTRVLIKRYESLVKEGNIPVHRILAFTFTEKAAGEIRERILNEKIINPDEEGLLQIGTIHAFCSRLLRRHGPLVGVDPSFTIAEEIQSTIDRDTRIRNYLLEKIRDNDLVIASLAESFGFNRLNGILRKMINEPRLFTFKDSLPESSQKERELLTRAQEIFQTWLAHKMGKAELTFNDLEILALGLLETQPEVRKRLTLRYRHLLVDEFQDTNPVQGELIRYLYQPGVNNLFIVGDPKQSIYRFRRADVSIFRDMAATIQKEGGKIISLKETFRIAPRLTDVINRVFQPLFEENGETAFYEPMESHYKDAEGHLHLIVAPKAKESMDNFRRAEARWIAEKIAQLNLSPEELDSTALLFRTSKPMAFYRDELTRLGIPCRVTRTESFFEQPLIRDLSHILAALAGDRSLITQAGLLRSSFFQLSEIFIERYSRTQPSDLLAPYTPDLFNRDEDQDKWEKLASLLRRWESLKGSLTVSSLFEVILKDLDVPESLTRLNDDERKIRLQLEQWRHLLQELENDGESDLEEIQDRLRLARDGDKELSTLTVKDGDGAVHLMTIHGSKGLEFKRVFLPQLYATDKGDSTDFLFDERAGMALKEAAWETNGLKIQLTETPLFKDLKLKEEFERREETKRLLYVAMTRVKEDLFLFLREPSDKKIKIAESRSWNEWLWELLKEERAHAIELPLREKAAEAWSGLAGKIQLALSDEEGPQIEFPFEEKKTPKEKVTVLTRSTLPFKPVYTVSSIETYLRCEKEYELRYIHGIQAVKGMKPENNNGGTPSSKHGLTAQEWGLFVHEVFQFLDFSTLSNRDTVIEQALMNQRITDKEGRVEGTIRESIERMLSKPEILALLTGNDKEFKEIPFLLDSQSFYLKGTLDRLSRKGDTWAILDFKTDQVRSRDDLILKQKVYAGQLACYALAASRILGITRLTTSLLFTEGPYLFTEEWDAQRLEQVAGMLDDVHASLLGKAPEGIAHTGLASTFLFPSDIHGCRHCSYWDNDYCGVKTRRN